jgi:hypothetical protein
MEQEPQPNNDPTTQAIYDIINTLGRGAVGACGQQDQEGAPEAGDMPPRAAALNQLCTLVATTNTAEEYRYPDETRYAGELEAAGLRFDEGLEGVELRVEEPSVYATALQQTPRPQDEAERERLAEQNRLIVDDAFTTIAVATVMGNAEAVAAMYGPITPTDSTVDIARTTGRRPSEIQTHVATQFPAQAGSIAQDMERLGAPQRTIDDLRLLSLAHKEGLVREWAAAEDLGVIDYSRGLLGVDRLASVQGWDAAYNLLEHLARTAPDARFTRTLRDRVLADIDKALTEPDPVQAEPPTGPLARTLGMEGVDTAAARQESRDYAARFLRKARERIPRILP